MNVAHAKVDVRQYLAECRSLAIDEIRRFMPKHRTLGSNFYDLMLDYPLRDAKGLRPALCIATCRALGGSEQAVLPTAAVIELYHNAFLIHDDVEDGSELRRDAPTLHRLHGVPVAINVGDGMLALALTPLLENTRLVGLGKSLRILRVIADMARESAEGQALELEWIRDARWAVTTNDYEQMVVKKTGWYSFIAPVTLGAIVAGASPSLIALLQQFARALSIAFQIRDDILNLEGADRSYGKERYGDLWEGKRTLMLSHMVRSVDERTGERAKQILLKPRSEKSVDDVEFLFASVQKAGSIEYANSVTLQHAQHSSALLEQARKEGSWFAPSVHHDVLHALIDFTVGRHH